MRKKLISLTYLRDASKYSIKINNSNDDYWYSVKELIDTKPFVIKNGTKIMDNGYYLLELLPKNENYSMRVYFNENKEIIQYYFDLSLGNGLDPDTKIPYYDDAYNDILVQGDNVEIYDEDELEEAYKDNKLTDDEYNLVKKKTQELYEEIVNHNNKYMNMNLKDLL